MSNVFAIVMLTGAACSSPLDHAPAMTVAYQVPCAVVLREPVGNPFKVAQAPNEVSATPPIRKVAAKKKGKKKSRRKR